MASKEALLLGFAVLILLRCGMHFNLGLFKRDHPSETLVPPPPEGPCPGCLPIFYGGLNDSKCFRIPTIIKTHAGTLLALAENRITDCGDNGGRHDIVARRSTDNGKTWGDLILVYEGQVPCEGCHAAASNPNLLEVDFHNGSRAILCQFDTMNNPSQATHGLDMQIWSYDDGVTWQRLSQLVYPPFENVGGMIGPSLGLQGASGTLYFAARAIGGQPNVSTFVYYSKDFGLTWQSSTAMPPMEFSNEQSMAFMVSPEDERILMNFRTGKGRRALVYWDRNLDQVEVTYPDGLIDPGCQGSMINEGGVLFMSNAAAHSRTNMTVKSSHDQGHHWSSGIQVWSGPSAYSQLVPLGNNQVGVLFEAGVHASYETISFVVVDVSQEFATAAPEKVISI
mmetsp:Transcript_682/g.1382  ORF Transcript_682/g.1382 Transcript_682/m.1382 type:complete len:395 (-) Transcript_682:100-1284(-)|eukprot:CAMPEP_0178416056 /NCGR_PEP_ID=MMETSP0689_2-20121128/23865_1 /TAXON_ID=160604 /ORGANISM="Amphidinium massartii, Strain CS-259" /LENGTH=394 /DNA_ID=CAMNT_0020037385 /DNA_START=51 /DNA_END=1235 /DNA_ORIENTATION=-